MDQLINPFHELYVTETARPEEFVQLFSDSLLPHALLLFQPGNVVLKGTQGSGKSMLLNLLTPEIRCAYHRGGKSFPVPEKLSRFISAGINLTRSGVLDIGQRPLTNDSQEDERLFPLFFADFVNYWIARDIIRSLLTMQANPESFPYVHEGYNDDFAKLLAGQECWFGYLEKASTLEELQRRMDERLANYRAFHVANLKRLPQELLDSKTNIGEPISRAVECLWKTGALDADAPLFVRIDQHEVLSRSDDLRPKLGFEYRRIINKALSTRDPRLSYRIGTRRYAWRDDLDIYGTTMSLEILRDYRIIDIDEILRRKEDSHTWLFPTFAEDIFRRRLEHSNCEISDDKWLRKVMGATPKPVEAARRYVGTTEPDRALKIEASWSEEWKTFLRELFRSDPLSAKLAEAWMRQKGSEQKVRSAPPPEKDFPWDRPYWKKERNRQALFQLAARSAQRPVWSGMESIIALCMGSTLVFVSVCQHIWDVFLRSQLGVPDGKRQDPIKNGIPPKIQALGIFTASVYWYQKISEQPGGGERRRFIDYLGRLFYTSLMEDRAMSYPGHNGFSLANEEIEDDAEVFRFLGDAVDYGDLHDAPHTTKDKDARQRTKWYLNPILSPYFRLPESHVKEPMYEDIASVRGWLAELKILPPLANPARPRKVPREVPGQLSLLLPEDDNEK
jgi:hypothetical protein